MNGGLAVVATVLAALFLLWQFSRADDCRERGGVYLTREFVCVRAEVIR